MVIYVDIDETICYHKNADVTEERDYAKATPIEENIERINELYDLGHTIVYWTARGSLTKKDWTELTVQQLNSWGAKYTKVRLQKPYYDLFIDDKAINADDFFAELNDPKVVVTGGASQDEL